MKMKATKPHIYAGKRIAVDQVYEVRGLSDARLMKALGRSVDYVEPIAPPPAPFVNLGEYVMKPKPYARPGTYSTAAVPSFPDGGYVDKPKPADDGETSDNAPRVKRAYKRRDMKAEE